MVCSASDGRKQVATFLTMECRVIKPTKEASKVSINLYTFSFSCSSTLIHDRYRNHGHLHSPAPPSLTDPVVVVSNGQEYDLPRTDEAKILRANNNKSEIQYYIFNTF
ncbi:hypothetical protein Leryth_024305, partial [Lithospermum erythrorhizon]